VQRIEHTYGHSIEKYEGRMKISPKIVFFVILAAATTALHADTYSYQILAGAANGDPALNFTARQALLLDQSIHITTRPLMSPTLPAAQMGMTLPESSARGRRTHRHRQCNSALPLTTYSSPQTVLRMLIRSAFSCI